MKLVKDTIESDTLIKENTHLQGMIIGTTIVLPKIVLNLNGMIVGNLILAKNSVVYHHGTVKGDIINKGGKIEIFGTVIGRIIRESGITKIHDNSIIND